MRVKAKKKIGLRVLVVLTLAGLFIWVFKTVFSPNEDNLRHFEAEVVEVGISEEGLGCLYILTPKSTESVRLIIGGQTDIVWENGKVASIYDVATGQRILATIENIATYEPPTYPRCYKVVLLDN